VKVSASSPLSACHCREQQLEQQRQALEAAEQARQAAKDHHLQQSQAWQQELLLYRILQLLPARLFLLLALLQRAQCLLQVIQWPEPACRR
jgi:hypothetical protein